MTRNEVIKFEYIRKNFDLLIGDEIYTYRTLEGIYKDKDFKGYSLHPDLRDVLLDLHEACEIRFIEKARGYDKEKPPMCMKLADYDKWIKQSKDEYLVKDKSNYCTDCTPSYQKKMINKGLCQYPEVRFFSKKEKIKFLDGYYYQHELIGVRPTIDKKYNCRSCHLLKEDDWINYMHDSNMQLYGLIFGIEDGNE